MPKYVWISHFEVEAIFEAKDEEEAMRRVIARRIEIHGAPLPLTQDQIDECIIWFRNADLLLPIDIEEGGMPEPYTGPIDDNLC